MPSLARAAGFVFVLSSFAACSGSNSAVGGPAGGDGTDAGSDGGIDRPSPDGGGGNDDGGATGSDGSMNGTCTIPTVTFTHDTGNANTAYVHVLPAAGYPNAVCNDGSQATYALRPGIGAAAKRWVLYMDGGGSCAGDDDCYQRYLQTPGYMTSPGVPDGSVFKGPTWEGIKSSDPAHNPDFYDATFVNLDYCSSDYWSGDNPGDPNVDVKVAKHWNFRGRVILRSILAELLKQGLAEATEVLLVGSSAGSLGVAFNADDVRALVPNARFLALGDAGFAFDYPDFDGTTKSESTAVPTARAVAIAGAGKLWGGGGDATCEARTTDDSQRILCRSVFDLFMNGDISSAFFVRQSEYDPVQLKQLLAVSKTSRTNPVAKPYEDRFAKAMATKLQQVVTHGGGMVTAFGVNDDQHGVVNANSEWASSTADGVLLPAALGAWYQDPCHAKTHITLP